MTALGAEGRRFESCLPDHFSPDFQGLAEGTDRAPAPKTGTGRKHADQSGTANHGIVTETVSPFVLDARLRKRFDAKVDRTGGCWLWTGAKQSGGYGHIAVAGRMVLAHRLAFEAERGSIPAGLVIDHLCGVPACVNPAHLRATTQRHNSLRSASPTANNARKTECNVGHTFMPGNVGVDRTSGRYCMACKTIRDRARTIAKGGRPRQIKPSEANPVIRDLAQRGLLPGMSDTVTDDVREAFSGGVNRTYAIADLHGRFDLLCRAIDLIEADSPDGGTFICLGDFVDRGPQARSIIDLLMAGPQRPNWEWIVLQGNHEAMMLECLSNPGILQWWIRNGGVQTLKSYGYTTGDPLVPLKIPGEHLEWLASLPIAHEDARRIFVHAGVPFDQELADAKPETLQWMLYPGDIDHGDAEFHPDVAHVSGKHIVHGHHQSASHPLLKAYRTNLDSFAWATGRLAIGVFDDSQAGPIKIMDAIGVPDARYASAPLSRGRAGA